MNTTAVRQLESDTIGAPHAAGTEWALVQKAIAGSAVAMELLLANHPRRLYRVAFAVLRNREDAEDALQEGLCRAFRGLASFEGRSSFSTWISRIVVNSALMTLRRKRSRLEFSLDEMIENQPESVARLAADERPNPEQIYAAVELKELIEARLLRLPAPERAAFLHYVINGHSTTESALTFGIPEATFKSRISRTRKKLAHGMRHSPDKTRATSPEGRGLHGDQR
jgi:RNA polymerase sigma-70 factor, ECF subfamily